MRRSVHPSSCDASVQFIEGGASSTVKSRPTMTPPPRPRNVLYLLENRRISKRAFRAQLRPLSSLKSLRYINGLDPKLGGVIVGCVFTHAPSPGFGSASARLERPAGDAGLSISRRTLIRFRYCRFGAQRNGRNHVRSTSTDCSPRQPISGFANVAYLGPCQPILVISYKSVHLSNLYQ